MPPGVLKTLSVTDNALLLLPRGLTRGFCVVGFQRGCNFAVNVIFIVSATLLVILLLSGVFRFFCSGCTSGELKATRVGCLGGVAPRRIAVVQRFLHRPARALPLPVGGKLMVRLRRLRVLAPTKRARLMDVLSPRVGCFLRP